MIISEPLIRQTPLRRYLSHKKLVDLLENKRLFISRMDGFKDQFEAEYTKQLSDAFNSMNIYHDDTLLQESGPNYWRNKILKSTYISCWTLHTSDNMALWRLYNGGNNNCVAIDTTIEAIEATLTPQTKVLNSRIVKVDYIDHFEHDDYRNLLGSNGHVDLPIFKNKGYKFEEEVRIIYSTLNNIAVSKTHYIDVIESSNEGKKNEISYLDVKSLVISKINLNILITKITISPDADNFYFEYLQALLKKFDLDINIEWSPLKNPPDVH